MRCIHVLVKTLLVTLVMSLAHTVESQVYVVSFGEIDFGDTGVTITPKVGDGKNVNDIVLYENVITVGAQQIDAIVRTTAINNGTITTYDYSGSSYNNQKSWFSPQATFNSGGGYLKFEIEFILGGSYNNGTNTGTIITLQDVAINSYDLDGNGNAGSNQYCDFTGFQSFELGVPTNLEYSHDPVTDLTRFRSTLSSNTTNAADEKNRIKLYYSFMSTMELILGSEGNGAAYFFLNFSGGDAFAASTTTEVPELDLNTYTAGPDNDTVFVGGSVAFTRGSTNIVYNGSTIDNVFIEFDNTMLLDGADEMVLFNGSGGSYIQLNFTDGQSISDVTIGASTYSVAVTVTGVRSKLNFTKSGGGSMSLTEAESLLDAVEYNNVASTVTHADRVFDVKAKDGEFLTNVGVFTVEISAELSVEFSDFSIALVEGGCQLYWTTASEYNNDYFQIERFTDETDWRLLGRTNGAGTSNSANEYSFTDYSMLPGMNYYRIMQVDFNGKYSFSDVRCVNNSFEEIQLVNSSTTEDCRLIFSAPWTGHIYITNLQGVVVLNSIDLIEISQFDLSSIRQLGERLFITCVSKSGEIRRFRV